SRSAVVGPSRRPASTSAWATQRRTAVSVRSRSWHTSGMLLPAPRTSATVSALNCSLNDRLGRLPTGHLQGLSPYLRCPPQRVKPTGQVPARVGGFDHRRRGGDSTDAID